MWSVHVMVPMNFFNRQRAPINPSIMTNSKVAAVESWTQKHEIPRKVLHGSIAPLAIGLYINGVQLSQVTPVLIWMVIPITICEIIRFYSEQFNKAYIVVVGPLMRQSEKDRKTVNGVIWYLIGLITVFAIYPKDLALLSVLLLSWADLAASTIGRAYGKYTPKLVGSKSLAGSSAAFLTGVILTFTLWGYLLPMYSEFNTVKDITWWPNDSTLSLGQLSLATGLITAISELFPIIDDNLSIPILSATGISIVLRATSKTYI